MMIEKVQSHHETAKIKKSAAKTKNKKFVRRLTTVTNLTIFLIMMTLQGNTNNTMKMQGAVLKGVFAITEVTNK